MPTVVYVDRCFTFTAVVMDGNSPACCWTWCRWRICFWAVKATSDCVTLVVPRRRLTIPIILGQQYSAARLKMRQVCCVFFYLEFHRSLQSIFSMSANFLRKSFTYLLRGTNSRPHDWGWSWKPLPPHILGPLFRICGRADTRNDQMS